MTHKYEVGDEIQIANGDWFRIIELRPPDIVVRCGYSSECLYVNSLFITDYRPKFDPKDAKLGMCFLNEEDNKFWFMCHDWHDDCFAWFSDYDDCSNPVYCVWGAMKRHAEGDIETGE